jgi:ectoine hydroxylase-related dioxygenase (phytanoyl-CoA dioxygenase family)
MNTSAIKYHSVEDMDIKNFFNVNGYVLFSDLFSEQDIVNIRTEFFDLVSFLKKKYSIKVSEINNESNAFEIFSFDPKLRKNLYELTQELRSITSLCGSQKLTSVFQKMGLEFPVLRNQAIRIDFAQEPQFLQGIHQDVRGMRSGNCLNFWIPLQTVNENNGTLSVFPKSHTLGGVVPKTTNESGYQIFKEEEISQFEKILLEIQPGHALMFHPYLFHGSVHAKENRLRLTITLRFDDISNMDWLLKEVPDFYQLDIQDHTRFT